MFRRPNRERNKRGPRGQWPPSFWNDPPSFWRWGLPWTPFFGHKMHLNAVFPAKYSKNFARACGARTKFHATFFTFCRGAMGVSWGAGWGWMPPLEFENDDVICRSNVNYLYFSLAPSALALNRPNVSLKRRKIAKCSLFCRRCAKNRRFIHFVCSKCP